ncbi:MAG TPA: menaquinone biosynthesis protein [Urbifossiella sp.]|nr:menaquinone biosynthesis protein [Urbifossiella sp.]
MAAKLRVGAVEYLNAKPLIERLPEFAPNIDLQLDLPSRLADRMATGELDVGLIPVVEYLASNPAPLPELRGKTPHRSAAGGGYSLILNIAIASRGPVLSVTLFSKKPWAEIRSAALDVGSRSSAALAKILFAKRYGIHPEIVPLPMDAPAESLGVDAVLLIGDRAMHACLPGFRYAYDLGHEWTEWTGLPFVYAVWAVRPGVSLDGLEAAFVKAKEYGVANAGAIALREAPLLGLDPGYCRRYLETLIRYDLGEAELAGMRRFQIFLGEPGASATGVHKHSGR